MTLDDLKARVRKEVVNGDILFTPQSNNIDAAFEAITMPHWSQFVTPNDIDCIYQTVTSRKLAGNFDKRKKILDDVMAARGFKFLAGGTNRATYKHMEVPTIVAKVPIDRVGLHDNQCEYMNQRKLWPYCAKMIQVTPLGAVGFAERLEPILNRNQFNAFAPMIYYTTIQIIGKYVMEDIGTDYYKNWGIRKGFGACLLDYVYLFDLDGSKLICKQPLDNGQFCFGEIDYDPGFNQLYCKKCGRMYNASELQMEIKDDNIVTCDNSTIGGKKPMLVTLKKGNDILSSSLNSDSIVRPDFRSMAYHKEHNDAIKVSLKKGDVTLASSELQSSDIPEVKPVDGGEVASSNFSISGNQDTVSPSAAKEDVVKETASERIERDSVDQKIADSIKDTNPYIYENPVPPMTEEKKVYIPKENIVHPEEKEESTPSSKTKDSAIEVEPVPEVVEEKKDPDEFPPNQWSVKPSLPTRPRRRIITDSTSSDVVQKRPDNPYNR